MSSISSLGVGSGIDAESIVTQLMSVEKQGLTKLKTQQTGVETKISAFGNLKSLIDAMGSKLTSMKSVNTLAAYSATSSKTDFLTATASTTATAGTYDVAITQLAKAHKIQLSGISGANSTSGVSSEIGSGSMSFSVDGGSSVSVSVGSATATLGDWRDAINAAAGGVTATIVNTTAGATLSLTASDTGKLVTIDPLSSLPSALSGLTNSSDPNFSTNGSVEADLLANYTIDGQAVTSKTNSDTTAIPGVTLNLVAAGTATLTVARDTSKTATALQDFVTAYNDLNSKIKSLTAYDAANKKANTLTGDSTARTLQQQFSSLVSDKYASSGSTYTRLADIGVSFKSDGSLSLDTAKLNTAIGKDSTNVMSVITSAATAFSSKVTAMTGSSGLLTTKSSSLQLSVKDLLSRQDTMQLRLTAVEKRYRAQFSSLDTIVSGMTSTSTYLTQALAKL